MASAIDGEGGPKMRGFLYGPPGRLDAPIPYAGGICPRPVVMMISRAHRLPRIPQAI